MPTQQSLPISRNTPPDEVHGWNTGDSEYSDLEKLGDLGKAYATIFRKLAKKGIQKDQFLGAGAMGKAFSLKPPHSDTVLKITTDKSEAESSNVVFKAGNVDNVVNYKGVFKTVGGLYVILMDRLESLSDNEQEIVDDINVFMWGVNSWTSKDIYEIGVDGVIDALDAAIAHKERGYLVSISNHQKVLEDISQGLYNLGELGVAFHDYHSGNIMKDKQGNFTIIDLGVSKSTKKKEIPVLEKRIYERVRKTLNVNSEKLT